MEIIPNRCLGFPSSYVDVGAPVDNVLSYLYYYQMTVEFYN